MMSYDLPMNAFSKFGILCFVSRVPTSLCKTFMYVKDRQSIYISRYKSHRSLVKRYFRRATFGLFHKVMQLFENSKSIFHHRLQRRFRLQGLEIILGVRLLLSLLYIPNGLDG